MHSILSLLYTSHLFLIRYSFLVDPIYVTMAKPTKFVFFLHKTLFDENILEWHLRTLSQEAKERVGPLISDLFLFFPDTHG